MKSLSRSKKNTNRVKQACGVVLVFVLVFGFNTLVLTTWAQPFTPSKAGLPASALMPYTPYQLGKHRLELQEPETPEDFEKGLMGRKHLDANQGMLFRFEPAQPTRFWMKGCLLPLDFIYGLGHTVVGSTPNVPPCVQPPCTILNSPGPVNWVLELPAGSIKRLNLHSGLRLKKL
jgi:uncharacterized protein